MADEQQDPFIIFGAPDILFDDDDTEAMEIAGREAPTVITRDEDR